MSSYDPEVLWKRWKLQQESDSEALGHVIQNLVQMNEAIETLQETETKRNKQHQWHQIHIEQLQEQIYILVDALSGMNSLYDWLKVSLRTMLEAIEIIPTMRDKLAQVRKKQVIIRRRGGQRYRRRRKRPISKPKGRGKNPSDLEQDKT